MLWAADRYSCGEATQVHISWRLVFFFLPLVQSNLQPTLHRYSTSTLQAGVRQD